MKLFLSVLFIPLISYCQNSAQEKLAQALIKQFKVDVYVDSMVRQYVSKSVQSYSSYIVVIQDVVVNKQIKYKWSYNF
jgi:hypothetical protein